MSRVRSSVLIVCTEAFWESLESMRHDRTYSSARAKLREIISHRVSTGSDHPREKTFSGSALKGYWHAHLSPSIILFHEQAGGGIRLLLCTDHSKYSWNSKNRLAEAKLARQLDGMDRGDRQSPFWSDHLRWTKPEDILSHPELPEFSPERLRGLLDELENEALNPVRYKSTNNNFPPRTEQEAIAYMNRCLKAHDRVVDVLKSNLLGLQYDIDRQCDRFAPR